MPNPGDDYLPKEFEEFADGQNTATKHQAHVAADLT